MGCNMCGWLLHLSIVALMCERLQRQTVLEVVIDICTVASCHTLEVLGGCCRCFPVRQKRIVCYCLQGVRFSPMTASRFTLFILSASPVAMLPPPNTRANKAEGAIDEMHIVYWTDSSRRTFFRCLLLLRSEDTFFFLKFTFSSCFILLLLLFIVL